MREALDDGIKIFLDFHTCNAEGVIYCVNGNTITDYDYEETNVDSNMTCNSLCDTLPNEMSIYGYIVQLDSGQLHITPALLQSHVR